MPAADAAPVRWPIALAGESRAARRLRAEILDLAAGPDHALILAPRGFDAVAIGATIHAIAGSQGRCVVTDCGDAARAEDRLFGAPERRGRANGIVETLGATAAVLSARRGTLILAGAGDLPMSAQARLARLLRDGEARVSGSARAVRLNLRVVATSELPLEAEVREGRFRADLYKRLAARVIEVPALRERREDVGEMASSLLERMLRDRRNGRRRFTDAALALLSALSWEGNVAELESFVRELAAAGGAGPVRVEDVIARVDPAAVASAQAPRASLREARRQFEREYIAAVLRHSGWRMAQAAQVLGIQRTNLYRKARQLGIARGKVKT